MSAHLIYDTSTGEAVSICSRDDGVADPLPAGLVDRFITNQEFNDFVGGWTRWDAATLVFVSTGKITEAEEQQQAANYDTIGQNLQTAMDDLALIVNAPDIDPVPAGNLTNVQRDAAIRALREDTQRQQIALRRLALNLRRVVRYIRRDVAQAE
jgi:hypothetical protein